jgi:OHCU decarboxylase
MTAAPDPPRLLPIDELNRLPQDEFAAAVKPLFEAAPPLVATLYARRPFASYEALIDAAGTAIAGMPESEKLTVINAHPKIGENPATVRQTSALSYREQGYDREAGLDRDEVERVYRELAELNAAYETKFGFRFVVFVNRRPKSAILDVLKERLHNPRDQELATGLTAMIAIARDRLRALS